jgi:hypothetical protein
MCFAIILKLFLIVGFSSSQIFRRLPLHFTILICLDICKIIDSKYMYHRDYTLTLLQEVEVENMYESMAIVPITTS